MTMIATTDAANSEPRPEELARRLLAIEAGAAASPQALAVAGERARLMLRVQLAALLGSGGFDALWARASYLARQTLHAEGAHALGNGEPTSASGIWATVRGHDPAMVQHALEVTLTSFISLLFHFISVKLGARLMYQIWPDLLQDGADPLAEETAHD